MVLVLVYLKVITENEKKKKNKLNSFRHWIMVLNAHLALLDTFDCQEVHVQFIY